MKPLPNSRPFIGTAGWTIPRDSVSNFPEHGTHLERYARVFNAVEINSSFHRPHRASTYERWAASVPDGFRFSVKVPKEITHLLRLQEVEGSIDSFLSGVTGLGSKLGCLLVQLPPSLAFDLEVARVFFAALRDRHDGGIVCEPRHATWLEPQAEAILFEHRVARVAADPDQPAGAREPGGWPELRYYRLHGSPRMYYSSYSDVELLRVAGELARVANDNESAWCIFDNTASGEAAGDALRLGELIGANQQQRMGESPIPIDLPERSK